MLITSFYSSIQMTGHILTLVMDIYAVPAARAIFAAKTNLDVFSLRREHVLTCSVLGGLICEIIFTVLRALTGCLCLLEKSK